MHAASDIRGVARVEIASRPAPGRVSGIGLAVVRRFVEAGAEVVALARHARPEAEQAGTRMVVCDVADATAVAAAFEEAVAAVGRLDIVVLNAGVAELDDALAG